MFCREGGRLVFTNLMASARACGVPPPYTANPSPGGQERPAGNLRYGRLSGTRPLPTTACNETDRPSWPTGSHPRGRTPITLPAAKRVPLVSIGAPRADSMSARVTQNPLQMPDIRLQVIYPEKSDYRSVLILGGVHIGWVGPQRHHR